MITIIGIGEIGSAVFREIAKTKGKDNVFGVDLDETTLNSLKEEGYNVGKYVPYGPVKHVMPYLFRRAEENTSVAGQTGRELSLLISERRRRRSG